MSEFDIFRQNLDAKLDYEKQTALGINPEQLQLAERLDSFFDGLYQELVSNNVPFYEESYVESEHIVPRLVRKKTTFRRAIYEDKIIPRKVTVKKYNFWKLYDRIEFLGIQQNNSLTELDNMTCYIVMLNMMQNGDLIFANNDYRTEDKYKVYRGLTNEWARDWSPWRSNISELDYQYTSIINRLEPNIRKLLSI